ncbi:MAG: transcription termination factor Rho [Planctomycetota bacterium]
MPQQQQKKKKRSFKQKKQYFKQKQSVQKGTGVFIDFEEVPRDLSPEDIDELYAALPKTRKKKFPDHEFAPVQGLNLNELHELAEEEGIDGFVGRNRRDALWEIAGHWIDKHEPIYASGVLDTQTGGHHWLRIGANDYIPTMEDVYVPASLVEKHQLERGMSIRGRIRPAAEGERFLGIHTIEEVDLHEPDEVLGRAPFKELVPIYPDERIILEGTEENPLEMRIVDLITPIGLGQRGLIVAPPRTGKTVLLHMLAKSIVHSKPSAKLFILLVDERPEEVTDFVRSIEGENVEVVSSTFDEPAARHLQVAEMVIEKAKCLVEAGEDVVILLDSITRLARAANVEAPSNGKLLSGGLEATALTFPKRFFGAARNIEDGGSLTILGTALIETGSKMDEVIFEEFKGTGNMEIVLERRLSDRRIFPAIDINRSGTRKEELLFTEEEIERVWMLRKVLNELHPVEAMEMLIAKMSKTSVNAEFLMTVG